MTFPVIIDTDPGIDDALALYLALASPQLDIKAITLVFGNTTIDHVTRNLVTLFDVIDNEIEYLKNASPPNKIEPIDPQQWEREKQFLLNRFEWSKPVVAIGADKPIRAKEFFAAYFHGLDGLGQIHTTHPHYTPKNLENLENLENLKSNRYTMSSRNATDEILFQLQNAPPFTITIIALGPLTNLALAYEKDRCTFSRVKQVICLGGATDSLGNTTPCAEFNFYADPDAAHILTEATKGFSPSETVQNKERLDRKEVVPLHFIVLPINVSAKVLLSSKVFTEYVTSLSTPLGIFIATFTEYAFNKMRNYYEVDDFAVHDPLAIALAIDILSNKSQSYTSEFTDMRVETQGIYTRGMSVVDRRLKPAVADVREVMLLERAFGLWSSANATNVEVINSYEYESFITNFLKIIFNIDYNNNNK